MASKLDILYFCVYIQNPIVKLSRKAGHQWLKIAGQRLFRYQMDAHFSEQLHGTAELVQQAVWTKLSPVLLTTLYAAHSSKQIRLQ